MFFAQENNVSLGTMTKEQFSIKVTRYQIPGVGVSKTMKFGSAVFKGRVVNFELLRKWADTLEPSVSCERSMKRLVRAVFRAVYFTRLLRPPRLSVASRGTSIGSPLSIKYGGVIPSMSDVRARKRAARNFGLSK